MYVVASNPFVQAYAEADALGKMIFFSLFLLSLASWVILVYKLWMSYQIKKTIPFYEKIFSAEGKNPLNLNFSPIENSQKHPYASLYTEVKDKTKEVLNKNRYFHADDKVSLSKTDMELIESALYHKINQETSRLDKNLFVLSMVVTLAPFLGLLGTVWGILLTFSGLTTHSLSNINTTVLSGLSMALTTTVIGLIVAIPALIGFSILKSNTKSLSKKMEDFSKNLLHTIELQYRKVDV
jgi:biopolymer transport protein TolQ